MEPYNPNKPFIQMKLEGGLLDRMVEMGIPFTRALQYIRNNPEGPARETLKMIAEDVVPFYYNYRHGGDLSDYAKEAVMLGIPVKGPHGSTVIKHLPEESRVFNKQLYEKYPDIPREFIDDRPITTNEFLDLEYEYPAVSQIPNYEKIHIQDPDGMNLISRYNKEELIEALGNDAVDEIYHSGNYLTQSEINELIDSQYNGYVTPEYWTQVPYDMTLKELNEVADGVKKYVKEHNPAEMRVLQDKQHLEDLFNELDK